jgi:hypothetical protein
MSRIRFEHKLTSFHIVINHPGRRDEVRTIIIAKHEKRRFPEKVDHVTSPGWLEGGRSRQDAGLVRGGPDVVVTTMGVIRFRAEWKRRPRPRKSSASFGISPTRRWPGPSLPLSVPSGRPPRIPYGDKRAVYADDVGGVGDGARAHLNARPHVDEPVEFLGAHDQGGGAVSLMLLFFRLVTMPVFWRSIKPSP